MQGLKLQRDKRTGRRSMQYAFLPLDVMKSYTLGL